MGVFEGVRAYQSADRGTCIFRLREHTDRLFRSAHIMRMKIPYTKDELNAAHKLVVRENGLQESYLRPMAFYGSEGMGLRADNLQVHEIGRASCRERVEESVGGGGVEREGEGTDA